MKLGIRIRLPPGLKLTYCISYIFIFKKESSIMHLIIFFYDKAQFPTDWKGPAEMQVECALIKQNYNKLNNNNLFYYLIIEIGLKRNSQG